MLKMKIFGVFLLLAACLSPAYGQGKKPAASGTAEAVKKLERDWSAAQMTEDIERLGQIISDDWVGVGPDGTKTTKTEFLNNVKTGTMKLDAYEPGAMDVKVMGGVAVVQGSDKEKSSFKGKDTSGRYVWTDVFVLRNGKWQAVRSQATLVP
jgi:hypothetical protein